MHFGIILMTFKQVLVAFIVTRLIKLALYKRK